MDTTILFSLISLFLLLIIIFKLITTTTTKPPPSPPLLALPLIGHLHHLFLKKQPLHLSLARLSSLHGPLLLLRFGSRPLLLLSSLPLARQCFNTPTTDIAFATRPQLPSSKTLTYNYTTLASAPYGRHWRNLRRISTLHLLSAHRLNLLSTIRRNEVELFVSNLFVEYSTFNLSFCKEKMEYNHQVSSTYDFLTMKKLELKSRLFALAFNVIMRMIAGKRYYGEGGDEAEEARRFREVVEETLLMVGASNVSDFVPALRWVDFGGVKRKMRRLEEKREVVLQGLIDGERRKKERGEGKEEGYLIEVLLGLQEEDPEYYTDDIIKALIVVSF